MAWESGSGQQINLVSQSGHLEDELPIFATLSFSVVRKKDVRIRFTELQTGKTLITQTRCKDVYNGAKSHTYANTL